jgi:hypothetical protein
MNETRLNLSRLFGGSVAVLALGPAALVAFAALAACSGDKGADAKAPESARAEALQHEDCAEAGNRVEAVDTNGDGKPDIRRVLDKASGRELCRIGDLNHDGKPEMYEYFDASGAVRRREFCYDDTGVVNAIEHYEGGKLVRREYDAEGQHHIDTWDFFDPNVPADAKTGRPAHPMRRERDTTGDGHVDQWWTWNGDKITIAVDSTGDGKPDPASTIVIGGSGGSDNGTPPPSSDAPAADAGAGTTSATTGVDGGKP